MAWLDFRQTGAGEFLSNPLLLPGWPLEAIPAAFNFQP
jgi:hypothetical protein